MNHAPRALLFAVALLGACGGAPARESAAPSGVRPAEVRAFEELEEEVLRDLAALDRRVAMRARITPREEDLRRVALGALLAEDPSLAVVDGAIDPFSFEARARGLAAVQAKIASTPRDLPRTAVGMTPTPAFERELLARLVRGEVLRLEEEKKLPRSASALVRAIAETWSPPTTPEQIAERERWIARRLEEVREAMGQASLDAVRARELDDALDAVEHLLDAPGFQAATAELVRVREALEAQGSRPAEGAVSEWPDVAARMKIHLGVAASPEELDRALAATAKDLHARAEAALAAANVDRTELVERLAKIAFAPGPCVDAVPGSRVRSMSAAPERAPACHLRHVVASASDDASRAIALAGMHDHVVVARWALAVATGTAAIGETTRKHPLFALASPDTQARLERIAQARPVMAIAAGEAVRILLADAEPASRARTWNSLGDIPLDIARTELVLPPVDAKQAAR